MTTAETLTDNTPVDPDDELLVAYLDGELSRQEQATLEDRLMTDDSLRSRLQQLQTGWDLLEVLPDPAPSLKLVESTLEMVVDDIVKNQPREKSFVRRFRFPLVVSLVCLVGVASAFAIAANLRDRHYQQQLRDLAIAEHLDAYLYGSDLDLMRQLTANPEWLNMVVAASEVGDISITKIANLRDVPLEQRDELIRELPPEHMDQLSSRWDRFSRFDEAKREKIRQTAEAVAIQPDSDSLLRAMEAYAVWRESLPNRLRDGMDSNDGQAQRDAIADAIDHTQKSISRRSGLKLDDESFDAIYIALKQILDQRILQQDPAILASMERFEQDPNAEIFLLARIVFRGRFFSGRGGGGGGPGGPGGGGPGRGPGGPGGGPGGGSERPEALSDEELQIIRWVLPDRAVQILNLVANGDALIENMTLRTWAEETVRRKFPRRPDETSKLDRYLEIPEEDRDMMDVLPPDRFLNELSREFGRFPFSFPR